VKTPPLSLSIEKDPYQQRIGHSEFAEYIFRLPLRHHKLFSNRTALLSILSNRQVVSCQESS